MTTKNEIRTWLEEGRSQGATHTIVVCDDYDHEDYPVHVPPGQDIQRAMDAYNGRNMQRIMEVYALHLDLEAQLAEQRAYHVETAPA